MNVASEIGKRCSRCSAWLPAAAFSVNTRLSSGLSSWCRSCQREEMRRAGPFPTVCADCGETFAARVRTQVRCPDCQAAMLRARKR